MYFLQKVKTFINQPVGQADKSQKGENEQQDNLKITKKSIQTSEDAFELLMLDILQNDNKIQKINASKQTEKRKSKTKQMFSKNKEQKIQSLHTSKDQNSRSEEFQQMTNLESSQPFQDLIFQEDEHEEIENMYIKDFIFVNKLQEARQLTHQEWNKVIIQKNLGLVSKKNMYFSLLKGIKFDIRKSLWQVFANTSEMKKLTHKTYQELINPESIPKNVLTQIDKDVPRSQSVTSFTKQLRNLLIGYSSLSRNDYTQGMNLIAGSLLSLLALENDEELSGFQILEQQFEQRVFWVFIGVMIEKKWQQIFQKDFQGLNEKLKVLQKLMAEHTPAVYQKLIDYQWDLTIFSQFYITIMLYNSPVNLNKIILDLFFIEGENILHSLIIRMLKLRQDKILGFKDECQLIAYFKKDMILDCYQGIVHDRKKAAKLEDFEINFMKIGNN